MPGISSKKWAPWLTGLACAAALTACHHGSPVQPPGSQADSQAQGQQGQQGAAPPVKEEAPPTPVERMSLDEKIGQMVIAGMDGYEINPHTRELIQNDHVGGLILYKPNVKSTAQLTELVNALKQANEGSRLPLWLGVDEEGGRVTRLPDELQKTPASQVVGRTGKPEFAYGIGSLLGKELSAYGFNVDFAPVMDVNSNPNNPVIGDRSFGAEASLVSSMGVQEMKGLQSQKVLPVVKHFPGHGDTSVDSHLGLPIVQNDMERLLKLELVPFAEAFGQQADAVMVAHILLPKLDPDVPASMSKEVMTNLLRKEMGFEGVIMTDDMTMGAIEQHYTIEEAAVKSVQSGANVIMVGHDYDKAVAVIGAIRRAVDDKRIPAELIDDSVNRIYKLKQKYQVNDHPVAVPDTQALNASVKELLEAYQHK
ncbi:beta-N-acetylhexosaminidase [Paenibacillus sp. TAB 01]|uniref:beta-N-acetylhexosaminidase n=1 Tax=Paenibacillus sp. TAB 01 TaxID=3368988 RepID=UPI003753C7BA